MILGRVATTSTSSRPSSTRSYSPVTMPSSPSDGGHRDDLARARVGYLASRRPLTAWSARSRVMDPALASGCGTSQRKAAVGTGRRHHLRRPAAGLRDAYRLQEELQVTADPDVGREDGATLARPRPPGPLRGGRTRLASGDAGRRVLARPASCGPVPMFWPPGPGRVSGGSRADRSGRRADVRVASGGPGRRAGQLRAVGRGSVPEQAERWVDGPARCLLPPPSPSGFPCCCRRA